MALCSNAPTFVNPCVRMRFFNLGIFEMEILRKLLLNEEEAAEVLGMSRHFLRRDRISKDSIHIPFIRLGASIRYRFEDLETWIEQRSSLTTPPRREPENESVDLPTHSAKRGRGRPRKCRAI